MHTRRSKCSNSTCRSRMHASMPWPWSSRSVRLPRAAATGEGGVKAEARFDELCARLEAGDERVLQMQHMCLSRVDCIPTAHGANLRGGEGAAGEAKRSPEAAIGEAAAARKGRI